MSLYVRFALKFDKPIPLSIARLKQISLLTKIHHEALPSDRNGQEDAEPLMELIIKNYTQGNQLLREIIFIISIIREIISLCNTHEIHFYGSNLYISKKVYTKKFYFQEKNFFLFISEQLNPANNRGLFVVRNYSVNDTKTIF